LKSTLPVLIPLRFSLRYVVPQALSLLVDIAVQALSGTFSKRVGARSQLLSESADLTVLTSQLVSFWCGFRGEFHGHSLTFFSPRQHALNVDHTDFDRVSARLTERSQRS